MILTVNGGSSSIKFALFDADDKLQQLLYGSLDNIGIASTSFRYNNFLTKQKESLSVKSENHQQAATCFIDWLQKQDEFDSVTAIGHRIVHGMHRTEREIITPELLDDLKKISSYDPEHLPEEIQLIELFSQRYPAIKQVACFDTSFHTTMPPVAKMFAIPRRYYNEGIHRYGFHGLSYAYLMQELENLAGKAAAQEKIILAHLGSGASLAAIKDGESMDTTMGFTPASGLPMSTRCGDIDAGIAWYLMQFEKLNAKQFNHLINHESGLLGVSETSSDMQVLMEIEDKDSRAAEAIELFCYQTKKWVGSYAAVLGGLQTLEFSGGIGEHSPEVRSKVCDGLEFLGIELCELKNMNNEPIISTDASIVNVRVIKTNEELMIARLVCGVLKFDIKS